MEEKSERNGHPEPPESGSKKPAPGNEFGAWLATVFLGEHPLIRRTRAKAVNYAPSDLPALISGETGTGKDLLALALHKGSPRGHRNPEVITAASLWETAWSILFGHRKGAFTNAVNDHEGVFSVANGSSVIIEDVCDLQLRVQPALLRAIEQKVFRPLGSKTEVHSDVRIIASTNRPLEEEVERGTFRADLYERLGVLRICVPPLRDHLDDLRLYVPHFLKKGATAGQPVKSISDGGMNVLSEHSWPRNVRELENLLRRAVLEISGDVIGADEVRRLIHAKSSAIGGARGSAKIFIDPDLLARTLSETGGNKREAAKRLGISRGTLYALLEKYEFPGVSPRAEHFYLEGRNP